MPAQLHTIGIEGFLAVLLSKRILGAAHPKRVVPAIALIHLEHITPLCPGDFIIASHVVRERPAAEWSSLCTLVL